MEEFTAAGTPRKARTIFAMAKGPVIAKVETALERRRCRRYTAGSMAVKASQPLSLENVP